MAKRGDRAARNSARRERQPSAAGHCIARVDREIDDDLLELSGVGANRPAAVTIVDLDRDRRSDEAVVQRAQAIEYIADIDRFDSQCLLPCKRQKLPDERRGAVGVLTDLVDVVEIIAAGQMPRQQMVAQTEDRRQHVVEIVRDTTCKLANRLHLGDLRDLRFEPQLLADIAHRDHKI